MKIVEVEFVVLAAEIFPVTVTLFDNSTFPPECIFEFNVADAFVLNNVYVPSDPPLIVDDAPTITPYPGDDGFVQGPFVPFPPKTTKSDIGSACEILLLESKPSR